MDFSDVNAKDQESVTVDVGIGPESIEIYMTLCITAGEDVHAYSLWHAYRYE